MTLQTALILLVMAAAGILLTIKFADNKPKLRNICLVILSVIAMALLVYIGITIFFIDAVRNQPPSS